jgi:predicted permease
MTTIKLVGDASIPLMLVVLGIELADVDVGALSRAVTPTVLKLGVAPSVGLAIAHVIGFGELTVARTFVLLCATPVALVPLALAIEYGGTRKADGLSVSSYLSSVIFVTTVLSVVVLTVLISLLRSGVIL